MFALLRHHLILVLLFLERVISACQVQCTNRSCSRWPHHPFRHYDHICKLLLLPRIKLSELHPILQDIHDPNDFDVWSRGLGLDSWKTQRSWQLLGLLRIPRYYSVSLRPSDLVHHILCRGLAFFPHFTLVLHLPSKKTKQVAVGSESARGHEHS